MREGSMAGSLQLGLKISCCEVDRRYGDVWVFWWRFWDLMHSEAFRELNKGYGWL